MAYIHFSFHENVHMKPLPLLRNAEHWVEVHFVAIAAST